jgi:hypothetical protein
LIATTHFHVAFLVENLEGAMAELNTKLQLDWRRVNAITIGEWPIRVVYSHQGPPYIELVEAPAGSPWDTDAGGAGLLHLGYWADDFANDLQSLQARGIPLHYDGSEFGFSLHHGPGMGIELIDGSARSRRGFEKALGFEPGETLTHDSAQS